MRIRDWSSDVFSSDLLILTLERLDLGRQHLEPPVLPVDRFELVFRRLESVLRERHPLLLGEVAIHQILGRDGDLADAILTEFLAVPAAENPEGRQDEAAARYACQEQPLLPSNRLVPGKVTRKRRDALARPTIEERTVTGQEIG